MATRILIVETNKTIADDLQERLKKLGYEVVGISTSSSDAVQGANKTNPDLILMNTHLHRGKDGIEAGKLIHLSHNTPIIYMTESSGQTTIQQAKDTGPFGYIFIPFNERQLYATLEIAILRSQLEKQIQENRQWLSGILNSIADGLIAVDNQGQIRFINPVAQKLTGWRQDEAVGKPIYEVVTFIDEKSREFIEILEKSGESSDKNYETTFESLLVAKDGKTTAVESNITLLIGSSTKMDGMVLAFRDISKQREAVKEIQRQAERAQTLVKSAAQLNVDINFKNVLDTICNITNQAIYATTTTVFLFNNKKSIYINMASTTDIETLKVQKGEHFEIPRSLVETIISDKKQIAIINDIQKQQDFPYARLLQRENIQLAVIAGIFHQQELMGFLVSSFVNTPTLLQNDDLELLKGITDQAAIAITNASLFEQVRTGREHQRQLAKSIVDIQETERRHIARELHDHLGQVLTGLQFMLENSKKHAIGTQRDTLEEIQQTVGDMIGQVREMSLNLRPSMLDDMGLLPTLLWHFERYESQTEIHVNFQNDKFTERFSPEVEIATYRIIQEALTNVARYAQVKDVFVGLIAHENALWIEVLDKGKGFDTSLDLDRPSSGLGGMRERASMVGGYLIVESYINQGTQIVVALPLTDKPLERRKNDRNNRFSGG
ncbi:MAG: PAS domain S-box protein [Chloroflexota bacterium]